MSGTAPSAGTPGADSTSSTPATTPPPVVKRRSNTGVVIAVVAVLIVVIAGVAVAYEEHWIGGSPKKAGTCGPITLQGDGAQIVTPLVLTWAAAYASQTGNQVNYPGSGSGTGITHFTSASIDFGISDSPLSSAQVAALPSPALTLPVTGSAIVLVYNIPGVAPTTHLNFTGQVLAEIWLGDITNWDNSAISALNPGVQFPNATIYTVDRAGSAGTTYVFTDFLSQSNQTWASTVGKGLSVKFPTGAKQTAQSSNSALLSLVNSTADTIGYSDLTDVLNLADRSLGYAAVENPKGNFIVPTLADTASAIADKLATTTLPSTTATGSWYNVSMVNANGSSDYPLATFVYMYVYQQTQHGFAPSQAKAEVLVQWLTWVISTTEGQSYASGSNLYYPALPASVLAGDATGISTMTYNGAAIPSC